MMMLDRVLYHNPSHSWLFAFLTVLGVFIAFRITKAVMLRRLGRKAATTTADISDLILALTQCINGLFFLALSLYAGSRVLTLPPGVSGFIGKLFFAVLLLQFALMGSCAIKFFVERYRRRKLESNAAAVTTMSSVGFVLKALLWLILLLVALDNFGVDVTTLIAGLGITGIAIALAVQNLLEDLFASFSIVFDKPFVIGDFIIVGEHLGTIEYIGLKTTRIRSLSGEQLIFSNGDLLKSRIRNFKRMNERRVVFSIGVLYQTTYEQLIEIPKIIRSIVERQDQVRFDRVHFKEYGAYALTFEIVYWVLNPDFTVYMDVQQTINLSIFKQFKEKNIEFAYPTQTLFVRKDLAPLGDEPDQNERVAKTDYSGRSSSY
jgi:small-conductance mechanosensitive channel